MSSAAPDTKKPETKGEQVNDTKKHRKRESVKTVKQHRKDEIMKKERMHKQQLQSYIEPHEKPKVTAMQYTMKDIMPIVDRQTKAKIITLTLDKGPYQVNYTLNGNHLGICGRRGHVAILDWKNQRLINEMDVGENTYGMHFFHTFRMYAVAQEKMLHIYDHKGTNIHSLHDILAPRYLEFLPYHFLLATTCEGPKWRLKYLDVSTGEMAACNIMSSPVRSMVQNPYNAIIINGHVTGAITMWSPNMPTPLVAMATHKSAVTSLAVTRDGRHLASASIDGNICFTDLRMMTEDTSLRMTGYKNVSSLSYSQRGLLAVSYANTVEIFDDSHNKVIVQHPGESRQDIVTSTEFCPYEDFIAVGRYNGVSTVPIPGSGSSVIDTYENNIYETTKSFSEAEVQKLLEKIPADMITLNPSLLGGVVKEGEKKVLREVMEQIKDEAAKTPKQSHRRAVLKEREKMFSTEMKPKKANTSRPKPVIKPIAEREALDLFK